MIFVSYTHDDRAVVASMVTVLRKAGASVWFDDEAVGAGDSFVDRIDRGLRNAEACVVCIGPGPIGTFARRELEMALTLASDRPAFRIVPVLLPGVDRSLLSSELPSLFLAPLSWVDLRDGFADEETEADFVAAVCGREPESDPAAGPGAMVCPYRGLDFFDEDDSAFFFGRETEQRTVLSMLDRDHCAFVVGASGCGKSSLVRAGILPKLGSMGEGGVPDWKRVVVRPGAHALRAVAASLAGQLGGRPSPLHAQLREHDDALALTVEAFLAAHDRRVGVAVVIDQFEHVFTLNDEQSRDRFLGNLLTAAGALGQRFVLLATLRADYYGYCATSPELAELVSRRQYLMGPMSEAGLHSVVTRPAELVGLRFQHGLVDTILDDVAAQSGALPLLEHALLETWKRRRGDRMTLGAYLEAGAVKGAIAQRAEHTYQQLAAELGERDTDVVRRLFVRLARVGDGPEDSAQPQPRDLLAGLGPEAVVTRVLGAFTEDRLLSQSRDAGSESATVEVAHEALIRGWPRYRTWLQTDREGIQLRQRLSDVAGEWERGGRDESLLYRGAQLERLEHWNEANPGALVDVEGEFLASSRQLRESERQQEAEQVAQQARARVLRRLVTVLVVAALVVSMAAGVAAWQWRDASEQRTRARALQEAALANARQSEYPDLALLLSADAYRRDANEGTRYQLASALTHPGVPHQYVSLDASALSRGALPRDHDDVQLLVDSMSAGTLVVARGDDRRPVSSPEADPTARISDVSVSADGATAAYGADAGVFVVDTATALARLLYRGGSTVRLVAMSDDGSAVAWVDADGVLRLWTVDGVERLRTGLPYEARSLLMDTGDSVVTGSGGGEIDRWEVVDERAGPAVRFGGLASGVTALDVSAPRNLLAAAAEEGPNDGVVTVWDVVGQAPVATWRLASDVTALRFDRAGRNLWAATDDGAISSFYVDDQREEEPRLRSRVVAGGEASGSWLDLTTTAAGISGLRDDGTLVRWRSSPASRLATPLRPADAVEPLLALASQADEAVVGVGSDGSVLRWSTTEGEVREERVASLATPIADAAITPDGQTAALLDRNGTVSVVHFAQPASPPASLAVDGASAVAIVRDGSQVAVGTGGGEVVLVEASDTGLRAGDPMGLHRSPVEALAFSPTGDQLASGDRDGTVLLTTLGASGRSPVEVGTHRDGVFAIAYSSDGRVVATGGDDRRVVLWDAASGLAVWELPDHEEKVTGLAFDAAEETIASVDEAGVLLVSRVSNGRPLYPPIEHREALVAITPGGPSSFAVSYAGSVDLWNLDERAWLATACSIVGREPTEREWADTAESGPPPAICDPDT